MWIMLSDSFLSIVATENPSELLVRARAKGDIERVFLDAVVEFTPMADYRYRSVVAKSTVQWEILREIGAIDYTNFKSSVVERDRHDAYLRCWVEMMNFQMNRIPKPRKKTRKTKRSFEARDVK